MFALDAVLSLGGNSFVNSNIIKGLPRGVLRDEYISKGQHAQEVVGISLEGDRHGIGIHVA